jgi:MFS family permease
MTRSASTHGNAGVGAKRGLWPLEALNFFMADMQAGIGPFLGVFLLAHHWESGLIGTVMTLGGVAGMIMTAPAGALIDATSRKRLFVIIPGICTVLASAIILLSQGFWPVAASQIATAIAGAAIGPAVAGITLGMVRCFVGLAWLAIWLDGRLWARGSVWRLLDYSVLMIPGDAIDNREARGLKSEKEGDGKARGFRVLVGCKPLLILAACLAFFHLGNGAMLPLYGLAVVGAKQGDPAIFVAETIVIAQGVMILASILAMRMAEKEGYWLVLLISFIALPIRGLVAAHLITAWGVYPVQMLDGVGAGLQSVAVPGLVARILNGTGRVNVGQGAVMTVQGLGASLSPAIGGWLAQWFGYPAMFIILGCFALVSIALWTGFTTLVKPACAGKAEDDATQKPLTSGAPA